jgi:hypothetical protein
VRLATMLGVLLSVEPAAAVSDNSTPPPELAVLPFTSATAPESSLAYVQQHVVHWIRRWGQSCDDPKEVEARTGPDGLLELYAATGPYAAVLNGTLIVDADKWTVVLVVTGTRGGVRWMDATITAPSLIDLLDALSETARDIAATVKRNTGRPVLTYVPPSRPYATVAFVVGGAALATGAVFFIFSGVENGKLSNPTTSLPDAVSARNAAKTYSVLGYSLAAAGIIGLAAGAFLFKPGAKLPAPAVSVFVDPARGMVLIGGPLP